MILRTLCLFALLLGVALAGPLGCGEPATPAEINDTYGIVETTDVVEHVEYKEGNFDFTGDVPISAINSLFPEREQVWHGVEPGRFYPSLDGGGNCVPGNFAFGPVPLGELPAEIEGVITLHPRFFVKTPFCDEDDRFYGSFIMQDSSGGVMVLKDSRIADFTYGNRVKLTVRGLTRFFGTRAVIISSNAEVLEDPDEPWKASVEPIFFEKVSGALDPADIGKTMRMTKKIHGLATNQNFNEMCMVGINDTSDETCAKLCQCNDGETDATCASDDCDSGTCQKSFRSSATGLCERDGGYWFVSIDREIGQRNPVVLSKGDVVEVTGPVVDSFGLRILVTVASQLNIIE